ncbi:unnamed protein product [Aphanomyces euteiches]|uniref:Uncharacterized protein n=1 Tax=Aphanomyces euteiches TaxID=100861 RepID=A0A6G0WIN7_9STRA|nr:hypothetical protein Ae201684_014837 [Aphanomyces euteiches]KAH9072698.1 hypothetical protein Ae201684P_015771 [Aphanomyces euteiches]KAH9143450.1 hypothetical protein AeRB84_012546 [Aphanomyces euteiches]
MSATESRAASSAPAESTMLANFRVLSLALAEVVDATLLTPCTEMIADSVINPYVLSAKLWDKLKQCTPQQARDISRLLACAISNSASIATTKASIALATSSNTLRVRAIEVIGTQEGQAFVQDTVASVAKTAHALNTPETRAATKQWLESAKSFFQMMATPEGQAAIDNLGELTSQWAEVAASPETQFFLLDVATNVCQVFMKATEDRAEMAAALEETMLEKMDVPEDEANSDDEEDMDENNEEQEFEDELLEQDATDSSETLSTAFEGDEVNSSTDEDDDPSNVQVHDLPTLKAELRVRHNNIKRYQSLRMEKQRLRRRRHYVNRVETLSSLGNSAVRPLLEQQTTLDRWVCTILSIFFLIFAFAFGCIVLYGCYYSLSLWPYAILGSIVAWRLKGPTAATPVMTPTIPRPLSRLNSKVI